MLLSLFLQRDKTSPLARISSFPLIVVEPGIDVTFAMVFAVAMRVCDRYGYPMFHPNSDLCLGCSKNVWHDAPQQLVLDKGAWRRMHQTCWEKDLRDFKKKKRDFTQQQ